MSMRRREVLGSLGGVFCGALGAASWGGPRAARAAPETDAARRIVAQVARQRLGGEGFGEAELWTYDGRSPGPELRLPQGRRVRVVLDNRLPQATTIHWHGVRIDNAMDGVAHLTQPPVAPGESFLYDFVAPDAGTYWYHPHNRSWEQLARGLNGALIVEEAEPPAYDRDLTLTLDDWRLTETGGLEEESFGALHDWAHAGRLGNWLTVNGVSQPRLSARKGERLRLRLLNASNASVLPVGLEGLEGWLVAVDGMPVDPRPLEAVTLAPAQRADLIVDVTAEAEGRLQVLSRGGVTAAYFDISGAARAGRLSDAVRLPANPLPTALDLSNALEVDLVMEGGAMGGLAGARIGRHAYAAGRGAAPPEGEIAIRELARRGLVWAFNGVAGMPEQPLFTVERGRTVRLRYVNRTQWPHGVHTHGHHATPIGDGETVEKGVWRDVILLGPEETREIAFVADNPGDWMLHCHMLEHQAAGMGTWFRVL